MNKLTKKQPTIVVDIDGVLFDTPKQAVERWNAIYGTNHNVTDIYDYDAVHDKVKFRRYHEDGRYDEGKGKFDDGFYDGQKDVDNYIPIEGARDALKRLHLQGLKIVALTARDPIELGEVTLDAIERHFGIGHDKAGLIDEVFFVKNPNVSVDLHKKSEIMKAIGGDILIDDAVRHVLDVNEAGIPAILLVQPYNKIGHSWPKDKTAATWADAERLIKQELGI